MKQWHCYINGKQYGPADEETLQKWICERRLSEKDLVWCEGMADWQAAGAVIAHMFSKQSVPPPVNSMVTPLSQGGTGGATPNAELMKQARELLKGKWGLPIGFCLLLSLISVFISLIPHIGQIANLIIAGPLQLGGVIFFLTFVRGGKPELEMLFTGFKLFGNALAAYLLIALFVLLWMLLLIIPGIIASYSYAMTFYIMADDKTISALDAIRKSKQMMQGRKWKLFCLNMRFIGWALLCILTLGIGFLWLWPYMSASAARFYEDIKQSQNQPLTNVA